MSMLEKYNSLMEEKELLEEDFFDFECSGCGKCCHNQHDEIILTGFDIFRLQKGLNLYPLELALQYFKYQLGGETRLPIHTLAMNEQGYCKFLKNNKCSCHEFKPITCAIYPIGRLFALGKSKGDLKVKYARATRSKCSGKKNRRTVGEWLKINKVDNTEKEVVAFMKLLQAVSDQEKTELYQKKFKLLDRSTITEIMWFYYDVLYQKFDVEKEYHIQAEKRTEEVPELFKNTKVFDRLDEFDDSPPKKQNRNDICACGSGKKYKQCCARK